MSRVTNGADLLVRCLENEGVKYIFGVPGEENLHILQSLKHSSICFVTVRNEQYAAIMAATYGHLIGRAGVALSTLGPGAANLVTGVAYAQMGGMPLVVLTGQKPIRKSKQAQFQILNLVELMRPLTKYTVCTESAERIPSIVREAFKRAEYEWPGAAHIEIPEDIAAEKVQRDPLHRTPLQLLEAPVQNILDCIARLLSVKRPLLMLASGCLHRDIQPALQEFQNTFRLPFFTTSMAKGTLDERRPEYIGTPVVASGDYIHCLLEKTDCVIAVGYDIREKPPFNRMDGKQLEVIHINYTPADLDDLYVPSLEVIGELSHSLRAMAAMAECNPDLRSAIERDWAEWREEARQAGEKIRQKVQDLAQSDSFPVLPQRFVADLRSVMPEDAILCLDIGMFALWLGRNYPVYQPGTFQLDKTLASMGTGVANGIVCKLVYPERKVVVVVGDGGLMMTAAGVLETAVSLGIHLVIIVVRDNAFGMIRYEQQMAELEDYAMDFGNPDLVLYAQSFGAQGHRVNSAAEFVPILNRCLFDRVKSGGGDEAGGGVGSSRQFQENPPEHLSTHHSQHQQHHHYRSSSSSSSSSQQGSVEGLRKGIVHVIDLPIDYTENKRLFVDAFKKGVKLD